MDINETWWNQSQIEKSQAGEALNLHVLHTPTSSDTSLPLCPCPTLRTPKGLRFSGTFIVKVSQGNLRKPNQSAEVQFSTLKGEGVYQTQPPHSR